MKKTWKKAIVLLLAAALCMSMTAGCGKKADKAENKHDTEEEIVEKADSAVENTENAENKADDTANSNAASETNGATFSYADIDDKEFIFCSGAGGWQTTLRVEKDGYFRGQYTDSDMGDSGENYENGTLYICQFTGHFADPTKVDEHTWSAKIKDIKYDVPGEETFADEMRFITSDPYGLMGQTFLFRDPETAIADVSEEIRIWAFGGVVGNPEQKTFDMYVLENVDEQEAFGSYDRMSAAEDARMNYEQTRNSYEETCRRLNVSDMPQLEMNLEANRLYKNMDYLLNYLWDLVKYNADEAEYKTILEEQRKWIKDKEADVEATGKMFEGGSMRPYVEDTEAAMLTINRCEELKDYLQKFQ